jgi:hypothetical protein
MIEAPNLIGVKKCAKVLSSFGTLSWSRIALDAEGITGWYNMTNLIVC